ncbi:cilium assembly protein DZIP1 isoform X2 [Genypterus blacodes]
MTPSNGSPTILPFKFRPRRESVDWRRINAVDVDQVICQLDVDVLQEHINTVTFCTLDGERCQRCQSPVDPALVKLLRLAQLTVEWLLHCQEFLTLNLHASEDRMVAAGREREQILAQQKKQEEKVKTLITELKQRKKIIRTQQSLLTPRIISNSKCLYCDKSFLNATFLQSHMQRRHPDDHESQLQSESEKKSQLESLKTEITNLKGQIVQQQQTLVAKTAEEKEQQTLHKGLQSELERFKAEEMSRMDRKIEDSRDGIRREMEFLYSRNMQFQNEANQTAKQERAASPVRAQPERDLDAYKEIQAQAIQKLEHQLKKQDKKWESRLQDIKVLHESEKNQLRNELSRMQLTVSEQQERSLRAREEMGRKLQEKEQTIKAQREQIRTISSNPPTRIVEVPVSVAAPAPEPKPKRVVLDSSSVSERRPVEKKPVLIIEKKQRATISNGKRNTEINKNMRPAVEQTLDEKLEKLGVKMGQAGLAKKELNSIMAKVQSERRNVVKGMPNYGRHREDLTNVMEQRLRGRRDESSPSELQPRAKRSVQVVQIRPRSSSLPSRATQVLSGPSVKQPKTPQPAPRTRTSTTPKTSTPNAKSAAQVFTSKTPPFSSDGESDEDDSDKEEEQSQKPQHYPRAKSPQPKLIQATPVQMRPSIFSQKQSSPSGYLKPSSTSKRTITMMDSDDDWSEVSELQEIDPRQLQSYKDHNGNTDKTKAGKENKINGLVRKMEKQFAERSTKKPAGGVSILAERKDEVQELTNTDLEESSDFAVSSLEDGVGQDMFKPVRDSGPLRKSLDSPSTSAWESSTGREHKPGLTEAGSGNIALSDFSDDSEGFSQ